MFNDVILSPFAFFAAILFAFGIKASQGLLVSTATCVVAVTIFLGVTHLCVQSEYCIEFLFQRLNFLVAGDRDVAT